MIILTETLETHLPAAEQAVGRPDVSGRGHFQNHHFWSSLMAGDQIVNISATDSR